MPSPSLTTLSVLDGNGNPKTIQVLDQSGAGSGPFTWGHVIIDGLLGVNVAQVTSANALKVDGSAVTQPVKQTRSTTANQTNVASSGSSVTVLASNAARLGATVYNDSTQILYLLLGTGTASTSVYTVQLGSQSYYEVPFNFIGQLTGIWASANGFARVTELT
jgi:hypothetical protein